MVPIEGIGDREWGIFSTSTALGMGVEIFVRCVEKFLHSLSRCKLAVFLPCLIYTQLSQEISLTCRIRSKSLSDETRVNE